MSYLPKETKMGNSASLSNSKSDEETANIGISYSGLCKSAGESSTKEEDLDSYRLLPSKWKETVLTIYNQNKIIGVLQEET